jgi:ATP-dependent RNA helicase SUPV3L1/SUV3
MSVDTSQTPPSWPEGHPRVRTPRIGSLPTDLAGVAPQGSVVCHLGPTNSGKTHEALAFLAARGVGVYAAPLRMLAAEAADRLGGWVGHGRVGLVTGEERVNPAAPLLCVTAEMAPLAGDTIVLDEVQWADDPERGSAWSRLLAFGAYWHVRLVGSPDVAPLLAAAFPNAEVRLHQRLCPLTWGGRLSLQAVPPASLVVAFSRAAVMMLARDLGELRRGAGRVAVLYGAMPPAARRAEIGRFLTGEAEVMVATDVVGHGINLPCRHVVFAETQKFDGRRRRPLAGWEVAQIAGRAGRYRLAEHGQVWTLTGTSLRADAGLVHDALQPPLVLDTPAGPARGYRVISTGRLRPDLGELGCVSAGELPAALTAWQQAWACRADRPGWLHAEDPAPLLERLQVALAADPGLGLAEAWALARAPVDLPGQEAIFARLVGCVRGGGCLGDLVDVAAIRRAGLADAEWAARQASLLRWFTLRFPGRGQVSHEQAVAAERAAAGRVSGLLPAGIRRSPFGRCVDCGRRCVPWFRRCDACHALWEGEAW